MRLLYQNKYLYSIFQGFCTNFYFTYLFYVAMRLSTMEDDLSKTHKLFRFYRPKKVKLSRVFESRIFTELIIAMKKFRKTKFRYTKVKG